MELYLERCLESIVNQSYTNLEIIIVNDGSVDNSLSIIKKYADADNRIVVIDKINEGIGGAYIDAFKNMSGDYISFVDGDDYIDTNMYEILAHNIKDRTVDIIQFGYQTFNEIDSLTTHVNYGEKYIEGNTNVIDYRYNYILHPGLGLKVFKKELFNDIKLLRQNIGIDILTNLQIYLNTKSMLLIKNEFYHIFVRENSVSRSNYNQKVISQLMSMRNLIYDVVSKSNNRKVMIYNLPTLINESIVICNYYYKNNETDQFKKYLKEYREYYKKLTNEIYSCRKEIILKAAFFYYLPVMYMKVMGTRIKI